MLIIALSCAEETNCRKLHKVGYKGLIIRKDSFILALICISITLTCISELWLLDGTFSALTGGSQLGRAKAQYPLHLSARFSFTAGGAGLPFLNSSNLGEGFALCRSNTGLWASLRQRILLAMHPCGRRCQRALKATQEPCNHERHRYKSIYKICGHFTTGFSFCPVFQETAVICRLTKNAQLWKPVPYTGSSSLFFKTGRI